ncbi:MAG TPA: hypothetical protein VM347_07460 [Nonomuraea sp.]|nr:hypothetical protein [Nonomuraea sp.]
MKKYPILLLAVGLTLAACGDPGAPLEVSTGARITTTTTGLDIDPDGYRIAVDGTELQTTVPSNGILLTRLDPGSRTIALTGLAPNCTIDGPGSRTVAIAESEVAPVEFAVVCTATSGVIGVVISGSGVGAVFEATVDGATPFPVGPGGPAYLGGVPAGDHVVSLVPYANCSAEPQSVTVTAGGLIRDTVSVTLSVTCGRFGTLRITAPTTGAIPAHGYSVWMCDFADPYSCTYSIDRRSLGDLEPNGTLVARAAPGVHRLWLQDIPANCSGPSVFNPTPAFTFAAGDTLNFILRVAC